MGSKYKNNQGCYPIKKMQLVNLGFFWEESSLKYASIKDIPGVLTMKDTNGI